jgi:hypothetical protein
MMMRAGFPELIFYWLAFPNKEVILRTSASIGKRTDSEVLSSADDISLPLAVCPFNRAASSEEFPLLAFCPIGEDTYAFRAFIRFSQVKLIAHLLAVEGCRIRYTNKGVFITIFNKRCGCGLRPAASSSQEEKKTYENQYPGGSIHNVPFENVKISVFFIPYSWFR